MWPIAIHLFQIHLPWSRPIRSAEVSLCWWNLSAQRYHSRLRESVMHEFLPVYTVWLDWTRSLALNHCLNKMHLITSATAAAPMWPSNARIFNRRQIRQRTMAAYVNIAQIIVDMSAGSAVQRKSTNWASVIGAARNTMRASVSHRKAIHASPVIAMPISIIQPAFWTMWKVAFRWNADSSWRMRKNSDWAVRQSIRTRIDVVRAMNGSVVCRGFDNSMFLVGIDWLFSIHLQRKPNESKRHGTICVAHSAMNLSSTGTIWKPAMNAWNVDARCHHFWHATENVRPENRTEVELNSLNICWKLVLINKC